MRRAMRNPFPHIAVILLMSRFETEQNNLNAGVQHENDLELSLYLIYTSKIAINRATFAGDSTLIGTVRILWYPCWKYWMWQINCRIYVIHSTSTNISVQNIEKQYENTIQETKGELYIKWRGHDWLVIKYYININLKMLLIRGIVWESEIKIILTSQNKVLINVWIFL